jgi:hypothetical protein
MIRTILLLRNFYKLQNKDENLKAAVPIRAVEHFRLGTQARSELCNHLEAFIAA